MNKERTCYLGCNMTVKVIDEKKAICKNCSTPVYYREEADPTLSFFYKPRTITLLVGILAYFFYVAWFEKTEILTAANIKR